MRKQRIHSPFWRVLKLVNTICQANLLSKIIYKNLTTLVKDIVDPGFGFFLLSTQMTKICVQDILPTENLKQQTLSLFDMVLLDVE